MIGSQTMEFGLEVGGGAGAILGGAGFWFCWPTAELRFGGDTHYFVKTGVECVHCAWEFTFCGLTALDSRVVECSRKGQKNNGQVCGWGEEQRRGGRSGGAVHGWEISRGWLSQTNKGEGVVAVEDGEGFNRVQYVSGDDSPVEGNPWQVLEGVCNIIKIPNFLRLHTTTPHHTTQHTSQHHTTSDHNTHMFSFNNLTICGSIIYNMQPFYIQIERRIEMSNKGFNLWCQIFAGLVKSLYLPTKCYMRLIPVIPSTPAAPDKSGNKKPWMSQYLRWVKQMESFASVLSDASILEPFPIRSSLINCVLFFSFLSSLIKIKEILSSLNSNSPLSSYYKKIKTLVFHLHFWHHPVPVRYSFHLLKKSYIYFAHLFLEIVFEFQKTVKGHMENAVICAQGLMFCLEMITTHIRCGNSKGTAHTRRTSRWNKHDNIISDSESAHKITLGHPLTKPGMLTHFKITSHKHSRGK
ncbi:hypothetical protein VP01_706g2 [Puccinia sorghi]|uniref:Uncharacterized protein n=1 Tax=Puccinia sorghi TaxID=27349 RepID=A0A0L6UDM4_9BASI|nr:hypothetical protein VP01_706g2 [Puccinia sorghi]